MSLWSQANGASRTGDLVARFEGWFGADDDFVDGVSGNGFIYPQYNDIYGGFGPAIIKADTNVMARDTFDLEAFKTSDTDGFTLIGYLDGVEVGRQAFDGVSNAWTENRLDGAIFDVVDEVQFVGLSAMDDLLIIA